MKCIACKHWVQFFAPVDGVDSGECRYGSLVVLHRYEEGRKVDSWTGWRTTKETDFCEGFEKRGLRIPGPPFRQAVWRALKGANKKRKEAKK